MLSSKQDRNWKGSLHPNEKSTINFYFETWTLKKVLSCIFLSMRDNWEELEVLPVCFHRFWALPTGDSTCGEPYSQKRPRNTERDDLLGSLVIRRKKDRLKSCLTLATPWTVDSTVHGTLQARILGWVVISFSRGSSQPMNQTHSLLHCKQILYHQSHQESPKIALNYFWYISNIYKWAKKK